MRVERELMRGAGPFAVLKLLRRREMYGYELVEALSAQTEGVLAMGQSTLYPMLYNLEAKGYVVGRWRQGDSGRRQFQYRGSGVFLITLSDRYQIHETYGTLAEFRQLDLGMHGTGPGLWYRLLAGLLGLGGLHRHRWSSPRTQSTEQVTQAECQGHDHQDHDPVQVDSS